MRRVQWGVNATYVMEFTFEQVIEDIQGIESQLRACERKCLIPSRVFYDTRHI